MKAVMIDREKGGFKVGEVPEPAVKPGQLKVRVKAVGLNRADLLRARGAYPTQAAGPYADVMGLELAGEVVEVGEGAGGFKPGDRVMSQATAAMAEYALIDAGLAMPVPERLSWAEAGACPVVLLTGHNAVVTVGGLRSGETVLVHAVTSGAGMAAAQIAAEKGAGRIFGTSASPEKVAVLRKRGLSFTPIDYKTDDLAAVIERETGGKGVDLVIDQVGASALAANMKAMALLGRLVQVGRLGGQTAEIDLDYLALKRLSLIGVTFRTRSLEEKVEIVRAFQADLGGALADGRLTPHIDSTFPLAEGPAAFARMAANAHTGKIVVEI